MRILVTGHLGKLGSKTSSLLVEHGHEVFGFDRKDSARAELSNYEELVRKMQGCECVVHTAGIPHPRRKSPLDPFFDDNVVGTFNVLKAAVDTCVKRVVYFSSTAYYGCDARGRLEPAYFPIDEGHPVASTQGYSTGGLDQYCQSKVMAEQLLAYYGTNKLVETIALRIAPANTKGEQYYQGFNWRTDKSYIRGCFFVNCHPDYVAQAAVLATEAEGEFWYEAFNIVDRFTHKTIDAKRFLMREYPLVEVRGPLDPRSSLITPDKAVRVLGFQPCEDLE